MVLPDEPLSVLAAGILSLYATSSSQKARLLEEASETATEGNEFSASSSNSTNPPSKDDDEDIHDDDKSNDNGEKNTISVLWLIIWGCAVIVACYVLYRVYRWWVRRRRILLSENAMDVLGDLHMVGIPSQDFSDSMHEDNDDDDEEEKDDGLL